MSCHGADRWVRTARYSGCSKKPWRGGILAQAVGEAGHGVEPAPVDGEGAHAMEGRGFPIDGAGGRPGGAPGELVLADLIGGQRGGPRVATEEGDEMGDPAAGGALGPELPDLVVLDGLTTNSRRTAKKCPSGYGNGQILSSAEAASTKAIRFFSNSLFGKASLETLAAAANANFVCTSSVKKAARRLRCWSMACVVWGLSSTTWTFPSLRIGFLFCSSMSWPSATSAARAAAAPRKISYFSSRRFCRRQLRFVNKAVTSGAITPAEIPAITASRMDTQIGSITRLRRVSSNKPQIDEQGDQPPGDPEPDVAIEGGDLKTQPQRDRKHQIEADKDNDVREGF